MIESTKGKETVKILAGEVSKKLPRDIQQSALDTLKLIDNMTKIEALWKFPGLKIKKINDQFSVRINDQWRILFDWDAERSVASNVEICDYH